MDYRVTVTGDAVGGWIVDIHDGTTNAVYRPSVNSAADAAEEAIAEHYHAHGTLPEGHAIPPDAPPPVI